MPSVSVKDVSQPEFTVALAAFLKKSGKMKVPEWVDLVKTNNRKELAPYDEDWFYIRAASMPGICTSVLQLVFLQSRRYMVSAVTTDPVLPIGLQAPVVWPGRLFRLWRD